MNMQFLHRGVKKKALGVGRNVIYVPSASGGSTNGWSHVLCPRRYQCQVIPCDGNGGNWWSIVSAGLCANSANSATVVRLKRKMVSRPVDWRWLSRSETATSGSLWWNRTPRATRAATVRRHAGWACMKRLRSFLVVALKVSSYVFPSPSRPRSWRTPTQPLETVE